MRLALFGRGRMGRAVADAAGSAGHEIVLSTDSTGTIDEGRLATADVVIEFTQPAAVPTHVTLAARAGVAIVVGTTCWYDSMAAVAATIAEHDGALVWGSNFSIGANLLFRIVGEAARRVEWARLSKLFARRDRLFESGLKLVAGVDEVGVGPLAGPLVAAAVILPRRVDFQALERLDDSKRLSPRARNVL